MEQKTTLSRNITVAGLVASWNNEKAKLEAIYEAIKLFNSQFKNANISALHLYAL